MLLYLTEEKYLIQIKKQTFFKDSAALQDFSSRLNLTTTVDVPM